MKKQRSLYSSKATSILMFSSGEKNYDNGNRELLSFKFALEELLLATAPIQHLLYLSKLVTIIWQKVLEGKVVAHITA